MPIQSKPAEVIQAQTAAFVEDYYIRNRAGHYADGGYLLHNLGAIAAGPADEVRIAPQDVEAYNAKLGDSDSPYAIDAPGSEHVISEKAAYLKFLRANKGMRHEDISRRAEMFAAYPEFAPEIARLKAELETLDNPLKHPQHFDGGFFSYAFSLEHDGKELVVIMPFDQDAAATTINHRLGGVTRAKGVPHFEQVVAASAEEGTTIAERLPGKGVGDLDFATIEAITSHQLDELIDSLETAAKKGIVLDFESPKNFLYDPEEGFGFVDLSGVDHEIEPATYIRTFNALFVHYGGIYAGVGNKQRLEAIRNFEQKLFYLLGSRLSQEDLRKTGVQSRIQNLNVALNKREH